MTIIINYIHKNILQMKILCRCKSFAEIKQRVTMSCEKQLYKNQFVKQVNLDGGPGQVNDVSIEDLTVHL